MLKNEDKKNFEILPRLCEFFINLKYKNIEKNIDLLKNLLTQHEWFWYIEFKENFDDEKIIYEMMWIALG